MAGLERLEPAMTEASDPRISPALPRRDDLDPVAVLEGRRLACARRHELAVERGCDRGLGEVERLQGFRERDGCELPAVRR